MILYIVASKIFFFAITGTWSHEDRVRCSRARLLRATVGPSVFTLFPPPVRHVSDRPSDSERDGRQVSGGPTLTLASVDLNSLRERTSAQARRTLKDDAVHHPSSIP